PFGGFKQLLDGFYSLRFFDIPAQRSDLRSQIALGLELRQNFGGVIDISGIERFTRTLKARRDPRAIEDFYSFPAQGFLQALREFLGAREAIERFLGQCLVNDLADSRADGRIEVGYGRRRIPQDGLSQI